MVSRREFLQSTGALVVAIALPACNQKDGAGAVLDAVGQVSLGKRIRIDAAGTVQLVLGKVELGQGIGTALAQIAALNRLFLDKSGLQRVRVFSIAQPLQRNYGFACNSTNRCYAGAD